MSPSKGIAVLCLDEEEHKQHRQDDDDIDCDECDFPLSGHLILPPGIIIHFHCGKVKNADSAKVICSAFLPLLTACRKLYCGGRFVLRQSRSENFGKPGCR
jgi:hypothetical protein